MSPKNRNAGRYRGFFDSSIFLETSFSPAQTRNSSAAPASKAKVDHSSTAPKANTAKIKRAQKPRTRTLSRIPDSRPPWCSTSIDSVVSTLAYEDILNLPFLILLSQL